MKPKTFIATLAGVADSVTPFRWICGMSELWILAQCWLGRLGQSAKDDALLLFGSNFTL